MMKYLNLVLLCGFLSTLSSCNPEKSKIKINTETGTVTKPVEIIQPTSDQRERRLNSENICRSKGIPVYGNQNALFMPAEKEVEMRTQDEVVDRTFALLYLGLKSEGFDENALLKLDKDYGITSKLSPTELSYLTSKNPTEQQKIDANWRYEGLHVLLWSLGFIQELKYPDEMCDVANDVKIINDLGAEKFRKEAKLRSKAEILQQADLILRFHWACVDARINKQTEPGQLDPGVVVERHHVLNWLIKYGNQDWDDVSTDT